MKGSSKATYQAVGAIRAECECGWRSEARNAQANAARHHKACGQTTRCETTRVLVWSAEQGEDAA